MKILTDATNVWKEVSGMIAGATHAWHIITASFVEKMALRVQDGMIIMAQLQTTVMLKKMQLMPVALVNIDDFKLTRV